MRLERARARQEARELEREKAEAEQRRKEAQLAANGDSSGSAASPASGLASDGASSSNVAPFVGVAFLLALVVLTLGLVPAYLVPWYRMSMVLEEHGRQFALAGGMAVLASGIFFLMVVSGG
jgi:hypothetical protein